MSVRAAKNAMVRGKKAHSHERAVPKSKPALSPDHKTLSVHIPLKLGHHGGRKLVVTPTGAAPWQPQFQHADNAIIKAVARAFRWRKLLETGTYASISEMAAAEKINPSYVSRVLRLTLLAPDIVDAVLDGKHLAGLHADNLLRPFPMVWSEQWHTQT